MHDFIKKTNYLGAGEMALPVNKPAAHISHLSLLSAFSMTATLTGVMEFQCGFFIWISLVAKVVGHLISFIYLLFLYFIS